MASQSLNTTFAQGAASDSQSDHDVVFLYETSAMDSSAPPQDTDISTDHEMSDVSGDNGVADVGTAYQLPVLADQDSLDALERRLSDFNQPEVNAQNLLEMSFSQIPAHLSNIIAERDSAVGWAELLKLEKTKLQTEKDELEDRSKNQAKQLQVVQTEAVKAHETISRLRQELEQAGKDLDASRADSQNQVQREIVQDYTIRELRTKIAAIESIVRNDDADSADDSSDEEGEDDADDLFADSAEENQVGVSKDDGVDRTAGDPESNGDEQQVSEADFYDRVNDHTRQASPPKPKNFKAIFNAAGELEFVPCNGRVRTARYHHRRRQGNADSLLALMGVNNVGQAQAPPA